jgi:predicted nucleic acid-binding protein
MTVALVDSDVLIWMLRGNAKATHAVSELVDWAISAVTYMEVAQGCRNKTELRQLQKALRGVGGVDVLPLLQPISEVACTLVEHHALSHSLFMPDALIAATALHHHLPLLTGNAKHFAAVKGLNVMGFQPT